MKTSVLYSDNSFFKIVFEPASKDGEMVSNSPTNFAHKATTNCITLNIDSAVSQVNTTQDFECYKQTLIGMFGGVGGRISPLFKDVNIHIRIDSANYFSIHGTPNGRVTWNGNLDFDDIVVYSTSGLTVSEEWFFLKDRLCTSFATLSDLKDRNENMGASISRFMYIFNKVLKRYGYYFCLDNDVLELRELNDNGKDKHILIGMDDIDSTLFALLKIAVNMVTRKAHFPCIILDTRSDIDNALNCDIVHDFILTFCEYFGNKGIIFILGAEVEEKGVSNIDLPSISTYYKNDIKGGFIKW